ncbi:MULTISPECIES: oligosaccharide repeat unit polymerase [Pantoea]|uniref:oligosaccharide repeat unit polymerase n=1 Tax=Pantoea TaxID=53335 RepID=UPI0008FD1B94|nr:MULTISPECIES: oligosaccharide repeat unit polymerase [unclassified Pantoea]OIX99039.1 hypothetical protein BFS13_11765 [Pantoea sp. Ae16]
MKGIKPSTFLMCLYFGSNIIFGFVFLFRGQLGGDYDNTLIDNPYKYLAIFGTELVSMVFFITMLRLIVNTTIRRSKTKKINVNYKLISWIAFVAQLLFLVYSAITGIGKLSGDYYNTTVDNPLKYIFTFINADYFFLALYGINPCRDKKNVILYLTSSLYRGWFAGALLNIFLLNILKRENYKLQLKYISIIFILFVTLAPSLYFVKYTSRNANSQFNISTLQQYYDVEIYTTVMKAVFERFQHVSETFSAVQNISILRDGADQKKYIPFYLDNFLKRQVGSLLGYEDKSITEYSAEQILNKNPGNIQTGILPWLLINPTLLICYIIFTFLSFFIFGWMVKILSNNYLVWPVTLWAYTVFALHGWFSAYFMIIFSYGVIMIISLISSCMTRKVNHER